MGEGDKVGRLPGSLRDPVTASPGLRPEPASGLGHAAGATGARFTPGPWRVEPNAFHSAYHHVLSFHPSLICKVEQDYYADDLGDFGLANARLIAAAPELYEALIYARAEISAYHEAATGGEYQHSYIDAALAKARGEQ